VEKKEFYKHALPHFQQPGQAYFVTWCIKDAVPKKALERYTKQLEILQSQIRGYDAGAAIFNRRENTRFKIASPDSPTNTEIEKLRIQYYSVRKKYIKAFDDLLDAERNPKIDLSKPRNTEILVEALHFWEGKKLVNHAYSIMPNHVHWVLELKEKDENGNLVYLQDVLQSVKRQTANQINKAEGRSGTLWQKESFDTTIRDLKHLYYAIEYTLNNPVAAGLIKNRKDWQGTFGCGNF